MANSNFFDVDIPSVTTTEPSTERDDLIAIRESLFKIEQTVGILADIIVKLNESTIRTDLKLGSNERLTESHLYKWSKL